MAKNLIKLKKVKRLTILFIHIVGVARLNSNPNLTPKSAAHPPPLGAPSKLPVARLPTAAARHRRPPTVTLTAPRLPPAAILIQQVRVHTIVAVILINNLVAVKLIKHRVVLVVTSQQVAAPALINPVVKQTAKKVLQVMVANSILLRQNMANDDI